MPNATKNVDIKQYTHAQTHSMENRNNVDENRNPFFMCKRLKLRYDDKK